MRVFLTGGTGFLGANVVRHLLADEHQVVCAVRASSPMLALEGLPVERVQVDLFDPDELARTLDGCEAAMHIAGTFDPGPGGEERMVRVHVDATRAMLEAGRRAGLRRVLVCSSSVTVGFGPRHAPGDEDTLMDVDAICGTSGPLRTYHDSKLESERLVAEATGIEALALNPDYVLGAWDLKPTSGAMILAAARRWLPLYPKGGKCFVDADDAAAAHVAALTRGEPGQRYLLGNHNATYAELLGITARITGRRPPLVGVPRRLVRAAGVVGRVASRIDPHRFAGLEPHVLASTSQERYRTGARARAELGLPSTPLEESVDKALRWFKDHGYW